MGRTKPKTMFEKETKIFQEERVAGGLVQGGGASDWYRWQDEANEGRYDEAKD